jgi:hypothetical protein
MLVGFVEQVSVDLGASPYIATARTQSLHALKESWLRHAASVNDR